MELYRQVAYVLAFFAFAAAALGTLFGVVTAGGHFVQLAVLSGLALVALGLFIGSLADEG